MKKPYSRSGLRFYLTLISLLLGQYSSGTILAGVPVLILGVLLHLWAKGCLYQNRGVTQSGPYRYVRHPFYLAYLLIDVGIVIMAGSWLLAIFFPFWWAAIYIPTMRREEAFLTSTFSDAYKAYRAQIPTLFPVARPLPKKETGFSWSNPNIAHGNEIPRILHILAYPVLFHLASRIRIDRLAIFTDDGASDALWLGLLILMYVLSEITRRHFKEYAFILPRPLLHPAFRLSVIALCLASVLLVDLYQTALSPFMISVATLAVLIAVAAPYWRTVYSLLLAETLVLSAALIFCGNLWLLPVGLLYYTALFLDARRAIRQTPAGSATPVAEWFGLHRMHPMMIHATILVALFVNMMDHYGM